MLRVEGCARLCSADRRTFLKAGAGAGVGLLGLRYPGSALPDPSDRSRQRMPPDSFMAAIWSQS